MKNLEISNASLIFIFLLTFDPYANEYFPVNNLSDYLWKFAVTCLSLIYHENMKVAQFRIYFSSGRDDYVATKSSVGVLLLAMSGNEYIWFN